MSQVIFGDIDPWNTNGTELAELLDNFRDAITSGLKGPTRPTELDIGGFWIDDSQEAAPNYLWNFKMWTGSIEITVFSLNISSGVVTFPGTSNSFYILKVSGDANGPLLEFEKQRLPGVDSGQVKASDFIGVFNFYSRDNGAAKRLSAKIEVQALEDVTATAQGSKYSFSTVDQGTATMSEKLSVGQKVESKVVVKADAGLELPQSEVAGAATIASLAVAKGIVKITGATATTIQGIDITGAKLVGVVNNSTQDLTLSDQNVAATAAERLSLPDGDLIVKPKSSAVLYYDETTTRWQLFGGSGSGGGTGAGAVSVADYAAIEAYPAEDRVVGMIFVTEDTVPGKLYQLQGGIANANIQALVSPTNTPNQIYGTDASGDQAIFEVDESGTAPNSIAIRDEFEQLQAATLLPDDPGANPLDLINRAMLTYHLARVRTVIAHPDLAPGGQITGLAIAGDYSIYIKGNAAGIISSGATPIDTANLIAGNRVTVICTSSTNQLKLTFGDNLGDVFLSEDQTITLEWNGTKFIKISSSN